MGNNELMTVKDALNEAIDMYWDKGKSVNQIKRHLYENKQMEPMSIIRVVHDLGGAIARFDSDVKASFIKEYLFG